VRIRRIRARADDMLVIRGVNLFPSEVEATLLAFDALAPHYQLIVDRRDTLPRLEVEVEPTEHVMARAGGFSPETAPFDALRADVSVRLRAALGLSIHVTLVPPGTVPRSEGKAVRVIERP
jgi:phenylacetate-CoA ligase